MKFYNSVLKNYFQKMREKSYFLVFLLPFFPLFIQVVLKPDIKQPILNVPGPMTSKAIGDQQSRMDLQNKFRLQLVFGLDLMVRAQRALHKENMTYTNALGKTPDVLGVLTDIYRIRIPVANTQKLIVEAKGERTPFFRDETQFIQGDRITIDQNFRVQSNFNLPTPPKEYLVVLAHSVLNKIYKNQFQLPDNEELKILEGVYFGFFRYEVRTVPSSSSEKSQGRSLFAIGIKEPVKNEVIDLFGEQNNLFEWVYQSRQLALTDQIAKSGLEKIYNAQKIYSNHTGVYTSSLLSLVPLWNGLQSLDSGYSLFKLEELGLDPALGFFAEISCREAPAFEVHEKLSEIYRDKIWTINGYGQSGFLSEQARAIDQIERARQLLDRAVAGSKKSNDGENDSGVSRQHSKPLLIDKVSNSNE